MTGYVADEHISGVLVKALAARGIDVVHVADVGLRSSPDPVVLEWAAGESRVLITADRATVIGYANDRVRAGLPMPGVALVDRRKPLGVLLDDLQALAECSTPDELRDRVHFIPIRF